MNAAPPLGAEMPTPHRSRRRERPARPWRFGLRWLLLALVLAVLVPTLALGLLATWQAVKGQRAAAEKRLGDTAHAVALAMDREFGSLIVALKAFAASPAFLPDPARPDMTMLDPHARRVAEQIGSTLILLARDGQLRLSTLRPPDAPLPRAGFPDLVETVFSTARPAVSNLTTGPVSGRPVIVIGVPILDSEGTTVLVAGASLEVTRLRDLLAAQAVPEDSFAAVSDAAGILAARSDAQHTGLIGRPIPPENREAYAAQVAGFHRGRALDGTRRVFAFSALPSVPGWTIVVAQPAAALDAAWRQPLLALALGTGLALALGGSLAVLLARRILLPLRRLGVPARAVAAGADAALLGEQAAAIPPSPVAELEALRRGFAEAGLALGARTAAAAAAAAAREAALRDRAALLEATSDSVLTLDPGWRVTFINRHAAAQLEDGRPLLGQDFWKAYPERVGDRLWAACHRSMRERVTTAAEVTCSRVGRLLSADIHPVADGGIVVFFRDVTEARAATVRLAESEARLRLLVARAPAAIAMFDAEMRYLAASRRYLRDFGLDTMSPEALVGQSHYAIFPHIPDRWRAAHARVLAGETLSAEDDPWPRAHGRTDWIRWEMAPWHRADGTIGGAVLFAELVTARIAAEQSLRERTEVLRLSQEAARIASYVQELPSGDFHWSPGAPALFGFPPGHERMTLDEWRAVRHPEDLARTDAERAAHLAAGSAEVRYEYRILRPDTGVVQYLEVRARREFDASGQAVRAFGVAIDVTERRAADVALAESEARFRAMADHIPQLAWMARPDGRFVWFNRRWHDYTGTTLEEMQGRGWHSVHHPDHLDRVAAHFARRVAAGEPWEDTFPLRGRDGSYRWFLSRALPIRDEQGRIQLWFGTNTDITGQREAAERHARLAAIVDCTSDAVISFDAADGRLRSWNRAAEALFGYTEAEALGAPVGLLLPPELAREDPTGIFRRVMAGAVVQEYETLRLAKDGSRIPVAITATRMVGADGQVIGVSGIFRDLRARKAAEAALRESEARFRALVDAMPQHAFIARPDGVNEYLNSRFYAYTGFAPGSAEGEGWARALHPEDWERTFAAWHAALASGEPYGIEHRMRGADGQYRWFLTRALPLRDGVGAIIRWFGTSTDISDIVAAREAAAGTAAELERRVAERTRALNDAAAELCAEMRRREEAQAALLQKHKLEALGQLTGGIAHDFNNVLAAITGSYRLIEKRTADPKLLEIVQHGDRAAERAAALVRQLLAFARREELRPAVVELPELLEGAENLLRHTLGAQIGLALEAAPGTWPVLADRHQLEVALLNLAVNARDAMPRGGLLTIAAHNLAPQEQPARLRPGEYVAIAVTDEGGGMPPEVIARATEPFFTTKPRGKGTGLGLAMVNGFAEQSGGCVRIESRPGAGTRVEIVLPRAALTGLDTAEKAPAAPQRPGGSILFAEDDAQVRAVTATFLRDLGYEVTAAQSTEAAVALAHGMQALDLLVTDMDMPGADGAVLAARLRAERPGLPVLFITGRPPVPLLTGEAVLRKPATGAELAAAVAECLQTGHRLPSPAERLLSELRAPVLRQAYLAWHAARASGEALPRPGALELTALGLLPRSSPVGPEAGASWPLRLTTSDGERLLLPVGADGETATLVLDVTGPAEETG